MSTKIWTAYRLKKGHDLWAVLRDIRLKTELRCRKQLEQVYAGLLEYWESSPADKLAASIALYGEESGAKQAAEKWGLLTARDVVFRNYMKQLGQMDKNQYDLNVALVVRQYKARFYLVPYPGSGFLGRTLEWLKRHPALEDFHYQDQTDKSAKVSDRAWRQRGEVWDAMLNDAPGGANTSGDRVVLEIVGGLDSFARVDPWMHGMLTKSRLRRRSQKKGT